LSTSAALPDQPPTNAELPGTPANDSGVSGGNYTLTAGTGNSTVGLAQTPVQTGDLSQMQTADHNAAGSTTTKMTAPITSDGQSPLAMQPSDLGAWPG
jgi:hypothetical protein